MRSLVSNSIYAKKDRYGPPSANQAASKDEPRCSHAVLKLPMCARNTIRPTCSNQLRATLTPTTEVMTFTSSLLIMRSTKLYTVVTCPYIAYIYMFTKQGECMGTLLSVSTFTYERTPMFVVSLMCIVH